MVESDDLQLSIRVVDHIPFFQLTIPLKNRPVALRLPISRKPAFLNRFLLLRNFITPAEFLPPRKEYASNVFCRFDSVSQIKIILQGLSAARKSITLQRHNLYIKRYLESILKTNNKPNSGNNFLFNHITIYM